jgi:hypothetical protein
MYIDLHVMYPLFLSDFKESVNFLDILLKNYEI